MAKQSSGERAFLHWWGMLSGMPPPPEQEFHFAKSIGRKWRFDFAWPNPQQKVAVEIDGGTWMPKYGKKSRHVSGTGFQNDCEKLNAAVILGWRVLRYTPGMLAANPVGVVEQIKQVLDKESDGE